MKCRQVELQRGNTHTITWIDADKPCKAGDSIRFKGENYWWDVKVVYKVCLEKNAIHHEWNAGGLDQRNRIT